MLSAMLSALSSSAEAQQSAKIPRIGYLNASSASTNPARIQAFRQGLRDLGYVEGKNIIIEYRAAEEKLDRLPGLAVELVRLKVDLIVTAGPPGTRAAKEAHVTIPIVMGFDNDPVGNGFVASLGQPGGNITGLSALSPEISGKRLELLKEVSSTLSHVAVFGTLSQAGTAQSLKEVEVAAENFRVRVQYLDIAQAMEIATAFQSAIHGHPEGVLVLQSAVINPHRKEIVDFAANNRLPAIYPQAEYTEVGGLMYYGANTADLFRRAATYVDKILKGAKPADLPVEQPTKFELVINLKTAKQIGLTIPPNVLARADRVIR
jgi:putative ABC transport system substrate-binding protein